MAREAHEAPTGSRTSSVSTPSISESRQAQMHAPFPSWSPYAAGAFVGTADPALAAQPSAAADSGMPSERTPGDAWIQSVPSSEAFNDVFSGRGGANGFLSLLKARNVTPEMFEDVPAAYHYLTGLGAAACAAVSSTASYGPASVDGRYTGASSASAIEPEMAASPLTCLEDRMVQGSMGCVPCYDHEVKRDDWQRELGGAPMAAFLQEMIPISVEKQSGLGYSCLGSDILMEPHAVRSLSAVSGSFSDYRRSTPEFMSSKRKEQDIPTEMASGSSGSGAASVTTRRRSEERAGGNTKKPRKEASKTSPTPKMTRPQAPKVDLGEKITALQQIVSPFGKTDRASVLSETIKYIKFLHDQIQLFSEPYMTKSLYKSGVEEEEETGTRHPHDLRSRGLCLVPVSWTSRVCQDDTLPDCWTPAHRSCLHR